GAWLGVWVLVCCFFFSSRRRHTRLVSDWSSDVCSSDLDFLLKLVIQGGQNLNDQLKEKVRRYDFIFEEFYKSSSDVLQKVTQIRSEERRVGKEGRARATPDNRREKQRE